MVCLTYVRKSKLRRVAMGRKVTSQSTFLFYCTQLRFVQLSNKAYDDDDDDDDIIASN